MKPVIKILFIIIFVSLLIDTLFNQKKFSVLSLFYGCKEENNFNYVSPVSESQILDLKGRWKFSLGDNEKWKEPKFDDSKWEKIYVPSSWENQGFQGYDGYAWYRNSFKLDKNTAAENLYLYLGYIDDVDQTYLNGKLIGLSGGFPYNYQTAYNAFRKYYIPKEYLNPEGENVIAIRIFDAELDGGIISGEIGIYKISGITEPDINLSGIWNFKAADDSSWMKNLIEDNQTKIFVPAHWDIQGYSDYDGFAWYQKSFIVPEQFKDENMILLLGKIDDIDQVYVNGVMVGSTGYWNFDKVPSEFNQNEEWMTNRVYTVPKKILHSNSKNFISVRVYDGFQLGGIYEGPIGLITQSNYKKFSTRN